VKVAADGDLAAGHRDDGASRRVAQSRLDHAARQDAKMSSSEEALRHGLREA
jgi:hypothetical protein